MDKIYSRKTIRIPKIKMFFSNNDKGLKRVKVIAVFAIAFTVMFSINNSINPIYNLLAKHQAKVISTEVVNVESREILENVKYEDLVNIEKDSDDNVSMLKFDVIKMNLLASDITYNIQEGLNKSTNDSIFIPMGSIFGVSYLAGFGPRVKIKLLPAGTVETEFKSSFESVGINQTIHRIYLNVVSKVNIVSQYDIIEEEITNKVLMAETVIVGKIPSTYYNLDTIKTEDTTRLMK